MYGLFPYYLTKLMIELPVLIIIPFIMLLPTYWAVGFRPSENAFWMTYFALEMLVQSASALGFMVSSLAPNIVVATSIAPAVALPLVLFGGLFVNPKTVFPWLSWIEWISPIRYCLECLCVA